MTDLSDLQKLLNSTKEELLDEINELKEKNASDEQAKKEAEKKVKALEDSIAKLNKAQEELKKNGPKLAKSATVRSLSHNYDWYISGTGVPGADLYLGSIKPLTIGKSSTFDFSDDYNKRAIYSNITGAFRQKEPGKDFSEIVTEYQRNDYPQ